MKFGWDIGERNTLAHRYDVPSIVEDEWHIYTDEVNAKFILNELEINQASLILNAGCGSNVLACPGAIINFDLFQSPLSQHNNPVCGDILSLPFPDNTFDAVVCIGEVMGYTYASKAVKEFSRVTKLGGSVVLDFGSTNSYHMLFTGMRGNAAALCKMKYIGRDERLWVYSHTYIDHLMVRNGLHIRTALHYHIISSLLLRLGASEALSAVFARATDRLLNFVPIIRNGGYSIILVGEKVFSA